jgi:DNA invertase Pin-like site-specific DNA recombinase
VIGYARVSTVDQEPQLQIDALKQAGCSRIFPDKASGTLHDRPELTKALDYLREGDVLVIWRLDRLGRSVKNLIDVIGELNARNIAVQSLHEHIDTSTAAGRMVLHLFAALAEMERDLIHERTMAGLEAARARGRVGGRKPLLTGDKLRLARQMYDSREYKMTAIADTLGVSRATVYRALMPRNPH